MTKEQFFSDDLKERIDALSRRFEKKERSNNDNIQMLFEVFSDLFGGLLVGAGLGYLIYVLFDTHLIVLAVFILLGGVAGFFNLYKSYQKKIIKEAKKDA